MTAVLARQPAPTIVSRLKKIAPYLLLGPISGLLVAGAVFNFRDGRPIVASLYGVALVAFTILLPYVVAVLGLRLI